MGGGQIDSLYRAGIDVENAFSNVSLLFQSVPMIHTTTSSSYSYGTIPIIQTETAGLISRRRNSMEFIKKYSRLSSVVFCVVIVFFGTTRHTQDKATTSSPDFSLTTLIAIVIKNNLHYKGVLGLCQGPPLRRRYLGCPVLFMLSQQLL